MKKPNRVVVGMCIEPGIKIQLEKLAKKESRSLSSYVRLILLRHVIDSMPVRRAILPKKK